MKRLILGLLCAAVAWGCGGGARYTITITVPEEVDGVRLVKSEMGMPDLTELKYDAQTSTYTGKGRIEEPEMAMIVDSDDQPLAIVCIEAGDIHVGYDAEEDTFAVWGTPSNDAVTEYRPQLLALAEEWEQNPVHTEEEQVDFMEAFYDKVLEIVDLNIDNMYGVTLFASTGFQVLEPDEILEYLDRFPKNLRNNQMLEPVRRYAEAAINSSIGSQYIDISAPDTEGIEVALSTVVATGKWVLVDFWATWCGPCRDELPYLKAAYEKYADKGFEIYGVSLDNSPQAWRDFVDEQDMNWINVLDVREDKSSPAADAYGIQSIPSNFLISPDGKIAAKNLRGEAVEETLLQIFD